MSQRADTVGIVGAGPFGVALASVVARAGRRVFLLSRDAAVVEQVRQTRRCARLPEALLPPPLEVTTDPAVLARESHLVVLAVASTDVRARARELGAVLDGSHLVVHAVGALARGGGAGDRPVDDERVSDAVAQGVPTQRIGVLAGPALPLEMAQGEFASMVVASAFDEVIRETRRLISAPPGLRVYGSHDVIGVELASAMAGAYTIALGLCDGLRLGPGPRAVLITRAIAEAGRLGVAAGGDVKTFAGLAGLGNLLVRAIPSADGKVASTASEGAPRGQGTEYQVGLAMARGELGSEAMVCEGARAALAVERLARRLKVRMPLLETMAGALSGRIKPQDAARLAGETVAAEE
ncbi:MAG: NAD(P)-binding domain-containing protein [Myxococcales bacterium]|nr:NAD(P)-binding domain-containing protein [Myxococcales bacterium]